MTLGTKVLEIVKSSFNNEVSVVKSVGLGTYIQAGGITQSGGVVETIWKQSIKKVQKEKNEIRNCLILGLGGGSVAKVVRKNFPTAKIVGVDVDSVIVDLGKKYLDLKKTNVEVVIKDAKGFVNTFKRSKFDLIIVDLYKGLDFPKEFEEEKFLENTIKLLSRDGVAIFNRLYLEGKRKYAIKFGEKLESIFDKVDWYYPLANLVLICRG